MDKLFAGLDDFCETGIPDVGDVDAEEEARASAELQKILQKRENDFNNITDRPLKKPKMEEEEACFNEDMDRITVHTIDTVESCVHEVAVPPNQNYVPLDPPNEVPSKTYPFVLDPFQKEAILCIDNNQSVLVSAHTSAGKTVVAEYSVAMCLNNKQRVIYTTPIKALSNQKYRDFNEEFSDVGLLTGDATINPNASCLIMTTEILRSMLYRGSQITKEVGWVIFDEIHYMRDKERGYVWEETIILLPPTVRFVFLSATIPNADLFAQWICYLHHQPCHVVYTDYRPVPLQHYIFPSGGEGVYLVVNEEGKFIDKNFDKAMISMPTGTEKVQQFSGKPQRDSGGDDCFKLVKMIMERNFAPAVVFSFSKRECEFYATNVAKLDFNMPVEKSMVEEVFTNAIDILSDIDKQLPQIVSVLPLLKRGIGIHHGGLLPIIKETIEILFGEGLIKVLFATETFAMGLNMPARTVMFTSIQKFDGKEFRYLTSGEYIQMSGRAGRRGKDDKGIVIMKVDETFDKETTKKLFEGKADPINSAFHLTYNMVLNLLRVEGINPEFILERSFFQFQNYASLPQQYKDIKVKSEEINEIHIDNESDAKSFYNTTHSLQEAQSERQAIITLPSNLLTFLQVGRLVKVINDDDNFGWCVVLCYKKEIKEDTPCLIVDVVLEVAKSCVPLKNQKSSEIRPPGDEESEPIVVPISWKLIWDISSVRLKLPADLVPLSARQIVMKMVTEAIKKVPVDIFSLDPIKHMKIDNPRLVVILDNIKKYENKLENHVLNENPHKEELLSQYKAKVEKQKQLEDLKEKYENTKGVLQLTELKHRKRVLRRLGYTTELEVIDKKGRIACEFSAADELLLTEMMFEGLFNDLNPAETCAILSTFVCDEKSGDIIKLENKMSGVLREMQKIARKIAIVCRECRLEIDEEQYVQQFKPYLVDVVHAWCKGASFLEICQKTTLFEGSIIRAMRRLEELLRQLIQASRAIGIDLELKFTECIKLLKRDIVFAPSLYL